MITRILAYADNDTTSGAKAVLSAMFKVPDVSCYTFVGDGPYSGDATTWINMMKQHFTDDIVNNRSMWSQGNHEHPESESQKAEDQIETWIPYLKNSNDQLDWLVAKQFGNVYVICGNTQDEEIEFPRDQFNWLKSELQKAKQLRAEGKIDWIVYAAHKPFFTLKTNHSPYTAVRFQYKDIFRDAQVDFVLHGHNHNTQLWKPMIPNQSQANGEGQQLFTLAADGKTYDFTKDHGQCYIVTGHAGHEWNGINDSGGGVNNVMHYRDSGKFGFTQLDFDGKKANVKSIDSDGKVHFEYNVSREGGIIQPPPGCPAGQCKDVTTGQCRPLGINETIDANGFCQTISQPPPPVGIDQQKALNFIKNSYKSNVGLLEEAPNFNVYWLWNDQLLGEMCLRHIDPALATAVENKMNSFGVQMRTPWATLNPKYRNNFSVKTASEPTISTNPPIRYSDYNGNSEFSVNDYADIAFLSAIHYHYLGDTAKSQQAYNAGKAMWDGSGMKDKGNITGEYAVYKVALGLLAQKITGGTPIGIPDNYFGRFQAANGGFTTDLTGGQPQGSQNIETTAAVLFAMNPSLLPTNVPPPPINKPPIARAGPNQTVESNQLVMLNGSLSTDPDGTFLTSYQWTQISGSQVTLNNANNAIANFTAPQTPEGIRTFKLTVTDTQGATGTDTVDINVVNNIPPPEEPVCPQDYHFDPIKKYCMPDLEPRVGPKCPDGYKWSAEKRICEKIDGGPPPPPPNEPVAVIKPETPTGQAGTIITLDGSQSKNANTYLWSTSPPTSIIGSNSGQTVQVQLPSDHTSPSSITLTVTNGTNKSNSITKNITVTQIPPPPPPGEVLWDSNIHLKVDQETTVNDTFGSQEINGKGVFMAASGNPRLIIRPNGEFDLEADAGHGRVYIQCQNYNARYEGEVRFNDNAIRNTTWRLRSRHNEGGACENRFGGFGATCERAEQLVEYATEPCHNIHENTIKKPLAKNIEVGQWLKFRYSVCDNPSKTEVLFKTEYDYGDGQGWVTVLEGKHSSPKPYYMAEADFLQKRSYAWLRINNESTGKVTYRNVKIVKITSIDGTPPPPPPPPDCPSGQCKDSTTGQCRPIGADEFKDEFGMCKKKPTTGDEFDEHGTLLLTSKIGAKITGQKVTMEVGSNHRNGQRYNVNHKFINYMGLGYIKTSPNQNTQSSKLDGPNHGSCKSLPKCCWLDAEIETDTFKSRLGSEWPHPDPHDYNAQSVKELNINVRDKWIGWCTINFENKDGWRELYLFGNPNPFLPDGKPNNAGWVEMLHEVDTGQITNNELAKRKMFTEDRGLEYELRCQNAGGDGHGDTTDMKWFYVWEITPPS